MKEESAACVSAACTASVGCSAAGSSAAAGRTTNDASIAAISSSERSVLLSFLINISSFF